MTNLSPLPYLYCKSNSMFELLDILKEYSDPILFISDPKIWDTEPVQKLSDELKELSVEMKLLLVQIAEPTSDDIDIYFEQFKETKFGALVCLGGGSVMDFTKALNIRLSGCKDPWANFRGHVQINQALLEMHTLPTTCGTGSESQSSCILKINGSKQAFLSNQLRFKTVILDPSLIHSLPRIVRCDSGLDAIVHSLESFVSLKSNEVSKMYSLKAWELLSGVFDAFINGSNEDGVLLKMQLGSFLAGAAIEYSMLGAAHSLGNSLSKYFKITHGLSVALTIAFVLKQNSKRVDEEYKKLASCAGLQNNGSNTTYGEILGRKLESWVDDCYSKTYLSEQLSPGSVNVEDLVSETLSQWTLQFNPVTFSPTELKKILQEILYEYQSK